MPPVLPILATCELCIAFGIFTICGPVALGGLLDCFGRASLGVLKKAMTEILLAQASDRKVPWPTKRGLRASRALDDCPARLDLALG